MPQQDQLRDPRDVLGKVHRLLTGELLRLMDGFYNNIEESLFELAYQSEDDSQRRRCFDLMRELRFRRSGLIKHFARSIDKYRSLWFKDDLLPELKAGQDLEAIVMRMADKTSSHFEGVLQAIAERVGHATQRQLAVCNMPIAPKSVAMAFVVSCRSLRMDTASIEIVQQLFSRFVLDGLGAVYGSINQDLMRSGYLTLEESTLVSSS